MMTMMLAGESNGKTLECIIILTDHMHFNGQNQHAKIQSLSVVRTVRDTKIMVEKILTLVANKLEDKPQGLLAKVIKDRVMT